MELERKAYEQDGELLFIISHLFGLERERNEERLIMDKRRKNESPPIFYLHFLLLEVFY